MRLLLLAALFTGFPATLFSQNITTTVQGGEYILNPEKITCITESQRTEIFSILHQKKDSLSESSSLLHRTTLVNPTFGWPVRQAEGFSYNEVWAISNYVDHNPGFPNQVTDYNCGSVSYDTASGYNHAGIDIFTWPFSWKQMQAGQAEVIAAAAGQIIYKSDGNYDMSCTFNSNNWNAVYILHEDGSIAWYGHMKTGSLTAKAVGDMVEKGEFLGKIGSSGNSTGPHLHFEVYDENLNLIDPYAGSCNFLNSTSWWDIQKPYKNPKLNAVLTHSAIPQFNDCPIPETTHENNQFDIGDVVYAAIYLKDQAAGTLVNLKVKRPDNSTLANWNFNFIDNYSVSYWFWNFQPDVEGIWKWEATYLGETVTHTFNVGTLGAPQMNEQSFYIYPNPTEGRVAIQGYKSVVDVSVADASGKTVYIEKNIDGINELDLTDLAGGIYYLTLRTADNKTKTVKIIHK